MDAGTLVHLVGLALLATANVGLWTVRVALSAAGRRLAASAVAAAEALLFALVFASVVTSLDAPLRVLAYAVGVGAGTLVGIVVDERLTGGQSLVTAVVDGDGEVARRALHAAGWPVATTTGLGVRGAIAVLSVTVDDTALSRFTDDLDAVEADAHVTVERLRHVRSTSLPADMHLAGRRARR